MQTSSGAILFYKSQLAIEDFCRNDCKNCPLKAECEYLEELKEKSLRNEKYHRLVVDMTVQMYQMICEVRREEIENALQGNRNRVRKRTKRVTKR